MSDVSNHKPYYRELGGALALYMVMLVASLWYGHRLDNGPLQAIVYASPMLAFFLGVWAVVRQIRRSDEFMRKLSVEHLAITAGVTAGWTFTYGFLENAGFPRLSMFTVWPVMGAVWALLSIVDAIRHR
ncbi:hypothetical protein GCM10007205_05580 [Oxalicibacterium flavum]|uniref:Transmembrane protein n=1 Tax=Oxalicibacterium flavum TaxID=179467 RepID=A0A8J2XWR7_9BURK|nr:hypothetical protein [Oxalicibacterium flavum]GGB99154.1 hypothetical protein GCM10007205_05580 [Oxalicibacterium flavum]